MGCSLFFFLGFFCFAAWSAAAAAAADGWVAGSWDLERSEYWGRVGVFDAHSYICQRDLNLELDLCFFCSCCCHWIFFRIARFVVFGWWICFCFVFMFLYGWVGVGGRERSELKKRQRRRLLIEEEASIATESKPNLSFSLCLLGSIKYIPSGTTLLSLSQEGVGVLPALLRF